MRDHSITLLITFLLIFSVSNLNAQNRGNWQGQGGDASKAFITGQVLDADSEQALEFATISIFTKKDSSLVSGGVTDEKGNFSIETGPGQYFAKFEYIGYQARIINNVAFQKGNLFNDLGTIALFVDAETLTEIEVRAEKSVMQMALDKKIFNVGKDLANNGGSAEDILDNVPSVAVDIDGNVSLRGSGSVRILIDGKPSSIVSDGNTNGLRTIPSNLIDKVEVITNPSAKYEAEGMAGIINIVMRKQQGKGLNGSFDFTVGHPNNFGTAINLNYRKDKLNFFTNIGLRYRKNPGNGYVYQEFYSQDTIFDSNGEIAEIIENTDITTADRDHERGGLSGNFRFGADYFFNPKNILTTAFSYRISDEDNLSTLQYRDYFDTESFDNLIGITDRLDNEIEDETDLEYSINYRRLFDRKGHEMIFNVRYEENEEEESSNFTEQYFDAEGNKMRADSLQRSSNQEGESTLEIQVDYIFPFAEDGKFEAGLRSSFRDINNDYLVEEFDDLNWKVMTGLSNNFLYNENIHAFYSTFGNKHGKFSYQLGLRFEYSDVRTELLQTNEVNDRQYFDPFPSVHLTYDLANDNAVQVSYSRRIRRPRFWSLNPFFTFTDNRNFFGGNPNLDPEYTNSYELGHIKYWDKGSLTSAIYYRKTTDVIERIRTEGDEPNTTNTLPQNLAERDAYGFEFTFNFRPAKWVNFNGDVNFFRSITDGSFVFKGEETSLYADAFSWNGRLTSKWTFWKDMDVQLRANYRAPRETTQGSQKGMYSIDLGASKDILKKKGTLTLSVRDLFNSRKRFFTTEGESFFSEGEFQWRARQVTLTLNYRLNQKKKRGNDRRGGGDFEGGGEMGF